MFEMGTSSSFHEVRDALQKNIKTVMLLRKKKHIQKRMSSALIYVKKSEKHFQVRQTMLLGEIDLLIQQLINCKIVMELQNCHWIQGNNESLQGQYRFCPEGPTSWCKYKKDISNKEKITIKKLSDQCIL